MYRIFFTLNYDDEYFAKTTEIDNEAKALITALYPLIKTNSTFTYNDISLGDGRLVTVTKGNNGIVEIKDGERFNAVECQRIFIENCAGVEYYGDVYNLAKKLDLAFANDGVKRTDSKSWVDIEQGINKHNAEAIKKEIGLEFADKKEASAMLKTIASETPKFNDLSFNVMSDICDEIISTLKKKNDDYGNSYIKNIERFGKQAMLIPMFNKLDRLESLSKKENQNFESFEDSLRDLTGYCLMAIQHLIKTRGK